MSEVRKVLKELKSKKAREQTPWLLHCLPFSFNPTKRHPCGMEKAKVTPGAKADPRNYRPISILSCGIYVKS